MAYLLGVDVGTSGTKTVLFDEGGAVLSSHTVEYPMAQPRNGWAEQDPEDWWRAAAAGIRAVLASSGARSEDIAGVGLSGQMHGLVALSADGRPLRPAILWCDQRTETECAEIERRVGRERLLAIAANPALTGFTAGKILWMQRHEPELWAKCRAILLPKDYVRYRLTGEMATDVSDASGTLLLDVAERKWSNALLDALDIPRDRMPRVTESCEIAGRVSDAGGAETGLRPGTPVAAGAGDNASAALGTGVCREGRAFTTIGTSGVVYAHTARPVTDPKGRAHTFCCAVPGAWHVMGVAQASGLSLRWFRDALCPAEREIAAATGEDVYAIIGREAETSPAGANRLLYAPYLMGERTPHLDARARGAFAGLSAMHTRADMARAVMEGVGYSLRDCLGVLEETGVRAERMVLCGGGAKSPLWRAILAALYGCPLETARTEGAALGAAILAGAAGGVYDSVEDGCARTVRMGERTEPDAALAACYARGYRVFRMLYPGLRDVNDALSEL